MHLSSLGIGNHFNNKLKPKIYTKVIFTTHGKIRLLGRGINPDEVIEILNNPIEEIYNSRDEHYHCFGSVSKTKNRYIHIIYNKLKNDQIIVITAMERDRGGLQKIGFSNL